MPGARVVVSPTVTDGVIPSAPLVPLVPLAPSVPGAPVEPVAPVAPVAPSVYAQLLWLKYREYYFGVI